MQNPRISMIMSVYNGEKYLKEAIDSILCQTFKDFEFIIINDGSTDSSRDIIEGYKDTRIRLFNNPNKGQVGCLNEAIRYSSGEYVAVMDADDVSSPKRFEKQVEFLDANTDYAMCGTATDFIDENSKVVGSYKVPTSNKEIRKMMLIHCPFVHSSFMMRREVLLKIGNYSESFHRAHDYELWTRVVFRYKTCNLSEVLLFYRTHTNQFTKKNKFSMRAEGIVIRLLAIYRFVFRY